MAFCQNCGSPAQGNFCNNCGEKLTNNISTNNQAKSNSYNPKFKPVIILLILFWASSSGQYLNNDFELAQANIAGLIDTVVASALMLCYPFVLRIINKEPIEYYECRSVCIGNSIIMFIISLILTEAIGLGFIGGLGAVMYYYINMNLFSAPKTERVKEENKEPIDDYIYDPSLSDIENQKKRFAEMDIEALDYLIKNSKNVYTDETYNLALEYYNLRSSELKQTIETPKEDCALVDNTTSNVQFQAINEDDTNTSSQSFLDKHKKDLAIILITAFISFIFCFGIFAIISTNKPKEKSTQAVTKTNSITYVASKNSDKYHLTTCKWAGNIKSSNKITFNSENQARSRGYSPCGTCID